MYTSRDEFDRLESTANKSTAIQLVMGKWVYAVMANGTLGGFDGFQLVGQFLAPLNYQAAAERIKTTPLSRQYDFFTRVSSSTSSSVCCPSAYLASLPPALHPYTWLAILLSLLIAGVFIVMEPTGAANPATGGFLRSRRPLYW